MVVFDTEKDIPMPNIFGTHSIVLKTLTNLSVKNRQKTQDKEAIWSDSHAMEKSEEFVHLEFSVANYRGLASYIDVSISTLAQQTKESAIDAIYGTNSAGSDHFAVLAGFDGTGVPLAYLYVDKSVEISTPGVPGKMVQILDHFLRPLLHLGFSLSFFDCDKDRSEIKAIRRVWPMAKV
ncbi:hypothetical protein K3495_g8421 [Podosphaera aphanis]|nr:hypothetical protein K3495_g8421 [Podosphaera aphanis]